MAVDPWFGTWKNRPLDKWRVNPVMKYPQVSYNIPIYHPYISSPYHPYNITIVSLHPYNINYNMPFSYHFPLIPPTWSTIYGHLSSPTALLLLRTGRRSGQQRHGATGGHAGGFARRRRGAQLQGLLRGLRSPWAPGERCQVRRIPVSTVMCGHDWHGTYTFFVILFWGPICALIWYLHFRTLKILLIKASIERQIYIYISNYIYHKS